MTPQYTGHNVEITDAIRDFTEKKLKRLSPHEDSITHIHFTFNVDKLNQIAEGQVSIPGNTIHAKAEATDLYAAIDNMLDKLLRQLNKHREKQTGHRD